MTLIKEIVAPALTFYASTSAPKIQGNMFMLSMFRLTQEQVSLTFV